MEERVRDSTLAVHEGVVRPHDKARELEARSKALGAMLEAGVPFLVGGAYALFDYTGIYRDTKDLDLFLLERDVPAAFDALEGAGFRTDLLDPRWIGKGYMGDSFIDLIFSSSNGLATVDDLWFQYARDAVVLGHSCRISPPEEMIFSKAFIDERERYDGADVNHLIFACGDDMDWERLLARFGPNWEVLFAHLTLYRFVYPSERRRVPDWLVDELCRRTLAQNRAGNHEEPVCRGFLISTQQYRHDYEALGFAGPAEPLEDPAAPANTNGQAAAPERQPGLRTTA